MKKIFVLVAVLSLWGTIAKAQQLPLYNQYLMNGFLLNPAIAGSAENMPLMLTVRNQWVGVKEGPATQSLSWHAAPFDNKKLGVGGYIFNDMIGPISRIGLLGSFAYHLPISGNAGPKLAFGLSLSAFQNTVDYTKITFATPDNNINSSVESSFVPDANFGAYFYDKNYFAGFSIAQLFQWKIKAGENSSGNPLVRHYFLNGGYKFELPNEFEIEPSALIKFTENRSPMQFDINAKAFYKKNYWAGLSYRFKDALVILVGMQYKKIVFGYSFDYAFSSLSKGTFGSHEFMIGFNIPYANKGASLL